MPQDVTKSAGTGNTFVKEGRGSSFRASTAPRQHVRRDARYPNIYTHDTHASHGVTANAVKLKVMLHTPEQVTWRGNKCICFGKKDITPGWRDSLGICCDACGKTGARVALRTWCRTLRGPLRTRGKLAITRSHVLCRRAYLDFYQK